MKRLGRMKFKSKLGEFEFNDVFQLLGISSV